MWSHYLIINFQDAGRVTGETALHVACYYGAGDIVKILLPRDDGIANKENDVSNNVLSSFQLVFISPFSYLLSVVHFIT